MYLNRASRARERAQHTKNAAERTFHEGMETSWMNLAASTAFVERVDLFLHTVEGEVLPYAACSECVGLMRITTIESDVHEDVFTFECRRCGATGTRTAEK
jgi:hypothetical protein